MTKIQKRVLGGLCYYIAAIGVTFPIGLYDETPMIQHLLDTVVHMTYIFGVIGLIATAAYLMWSADRKTKKKKDKGY